MFLTGLLKGLRHFRFVHWPNRQAVTGMITFDVVLGRVFNAIPQMVPDDSDTNDVCVHLSENLLLLGNAVVILLLLLLLLLSLSSVKLFILSINYYYSPVLDFLCMYMYVCFLYYIVIRYLSILHIPIF